MIIGVVREERNQEHRVALTPAAAKTLIDNNHQVLIEDNAGLDSGFFNEYYRQMGCEILYSREEVYGRSDIILKISPLILDDLKYISEKQIIFSWHHLVVSRKEIIEELMKKRVTAIGYEIIEEDDGSLPILTTMSELAGKMAIMVGAQYMQNEYGGRATILSGIAGVPESNVVILGGGTVGLNAARIAAGVGAKVMVLDTDIEKLKRIHQLIGPHVTTAYSNSFNIAKAVSFADLLIGAVLITGEESPLLVTREMVQGMKPRALILDLSIDQGGCVETSRPTNLADPIYIEENIIHYCVPNMTSNVSRTASYALSNVHLNYILRIANQGLDTALTSSFALRRGSFIFKGMITRRVLSKRFGFEYKDINTLLSSNWLND